MSFFWQKMDNGEFEIVMKVGTTHRSMGLDRRFALCTHENDAETIVELLNKAEYEGELKE